MIDPVGYPTGFAAVHLKETPLALAILALLFFFPFPRSNLTAQQGAPSRTREVEAVRASGPIEVDGRLDEEAWRAAGVADGFTQVQPSVGRPATQRTAVQILFDDRFIYFGIDASDSNPEAISRTITRRDGGVPGDDAVAIILDTFDDDNNAYFFGVNSLGTQQDGRWADNGRTRDPQWDGSWKSAGRVTDTGWTAEIAIPFETVRFNRRTDRWGLNIIRFIPRNLEESHWTPGLSEWFRIAEIGSITGLDLTEAVTKNYTIIPYVQYAFTNEEEPKGELGLNLRYSLSSNLGLDLTFNPDFATVEADVEQVNLTRYELSYPEKRPFFLEGAENYSTRIRQFYSRRIGEIPWGGKINGKIGPWRINALATISDSSATAPSESGKDALYSVFRVSRELPNASNVGLLGANRTYDGDNEGSLGLVGTLFFTQFLGMTSQVVRSYGDFSDGAWTYFFRPSYDSQTGHFHVRYTHVGEYVQENMNRVGFIRDDNRREVDSNIRKQVWINRFGFQDLTPSINYNRFWSQSGELRSWEIRNNVSLNLFRNWSVELSNTEEFKAEEEGLFEKDFRNSLNQVDLTFDSRTGRSISAYYGKGTNFDSDVERFGGRVDLKLTDALNATYNLIRLWFSPDPKERSSWIHYVRATYYVNKDMYFKLFYQSKYDVTGSFSDPDFDLERETTQFVYVWRFFPPFGSLQLAYQQGPSQIGDEAGSYRTLFTKLSWVF
ncbi:MAG: DUF5916 domain-containing protein [Gemmatimonadota bacterium]|jgi:hypothetical protein